MLLGARLPAILRTLAKFLGPRHLTGTLGPNNSWVTVRSQLGHSWVYSWVTVGSRVFARTSQFR